MSEISDKVKQMVTGNKTAKFVKYLDGNLWYKVDYSDPSRLAAVMSTFEFPVPISDIGNATFRAEDGAILFMRYIRKHLELLEEAKQEHCGYCHRLMSKCPGHMDGHNA